MFDFSWSEIALIVVVALVFIGPKDMPTAIRAVSRGIKAVRRMASEFQGHVDDMIREADLGEARDHLRDLKRFDFRDRIARTIDSDQTISKSLDFTPPPSLSSPAHAGPSAIPVSGPGVATSEPQTAVEKPDEPGGPSILPPSTARRLRHEETLWHAPAIIPPMRVIHNRRRVSLDLPDAATSRTVPPVTGRSARSSAVSSTVHPVAETSSDPDLTASIHAHGPIQPECPTAP